MSYNPLKIGRHGLFTIAPELDFENELNVEVDCECQLDTYWSTKDLFALRDHLIALTESLEVD